MPGTLFFTWPQPIVKEFLRLTDSYRDLIFIPHAAVAFPFSEYEEKVKEVFEGMGFTLKSIHPIDKKHEAIKKAGAIIVGGGNSFALLNRMYQENLLDVVRETVLSGTPYIGWSAGANLACPTIMTTNDMPVVQPPSLKALNLVPFQINPHYHELKFEAQGGETRKERLEEFLVLNPHKKVIGLPEGMLLHRSGGKLTLKGVGAAKLYEAGGIVRDLSPEQDMSELLQTNI